LPLRPLLETKNFPQKEEWKGESWIKTLNAGMSFSTPNLLRGLPSGKHGALTVAGYIWPVSFTGYAFVKS